MQSRTSRGGVLKFVISAMVLLCAMQSFGQAIDSLRAALRNQSASEKHPTQLALSQAYSRTRPDSALYFARESLRSAQRTQQDSAVAKSHKWLGDLYQGKSNYPMAAASYWNAIRLARRIGNKKIESAALNGLGITYYLQKDYPKAEQLITQAAGLRFQTGDYQYYSIILSNLAALYFQKGEYRKAISLLRKVEKSLHQKQAGPYLPSLYNTLGGCYQVGFPSKDSAVYYYKKSIAAAKQFNVPENEMTGYHNLGESALRAGKPAEALSYLLPALRLAEQLGNKSYLVNIYSTIAEAHEASGNLAKALEFKKKEFAASQEVFEIEKLKAVKDLEIRYETAVKDQKLSAQAQRLKKAELQHEVEKNRRNLILFVLILVSLSLIFAVLFFNNRRKLAEKHKKEKQRIFENIVHDIRTPITLIRGQLDLILGESRDNEPRISQINEQAEELIALVNELLDASQLDQKMYTPTHKIGEVQPVFEKHALRLKNAVREKNITVEVQADLSPRLIRYPADVLDKVLANLLSNAIKFTPHNGTIRLRAEELDSALCFHVFNSGSRIGREHVTRIFERFYRLPEEQIAGSGIGLSIAKELLDLVGGTIECRDLASGVEFTFFLPVKPILPDAAETSSSDHKPVLLVVDDNADIRNLVGSFLSSHFRLLFAVDGKQGLEIAQSQFPDLILTDLIMPGTDGAGFIANLKASEETAHIPVVVCSAKNNEDTKLRALNLGAVSYITKPFRPKEVLATLLSIYQQEQVVKDKYHELEDDSRICEERLRSQHEFVNRAVEAVLKHIDDPAFDVHVLAEKLYLSRSQLHRKLIQLTGLSSSQFIKMVRLEKAKDYLLSGQYNITETAYKCGFGSQSNFSKSFQEYTGCTASEYAKQALHRNNATNNNKNATLENT